MAKDGGLKTLKNEKCLLGRYLNKTKEKFLRNKTVREFIADNLWNIVVLMQIISFVVSSFGVAEVWRSSSRNEMLVASMKIFGVIALLYFFYSSFHVYYIRPKITRRLDDLSTKTQYNVMKIGERPVWPMFLGLILILIYVAIDLTLLYIVEEVWPQFAVIDKILTSTYLVGISLLFTVVPAMLSLRFSATRKMEISFNLIENIEDLSEKPRIRSNHPRLKFDDALRPLEGPVTIGRNEYVGVWRFLIKILAYDSNLIVRKHVGISDLNLYVPFNVVSLVQ